MDEVADALDICNRVLANKGHRPLGLCLEGHTDSDDLALSAKRAEVCRDYLVRRLCRLRGDEDMEASAALISSQGFGSGGLGRRCVMAKVVVEDDYVEEGEDAWRETPEHLQTLTQQMCGAAERNADVAKGAAEEARRVVEQAAKEAEEEIAEEEAIVRAKVEEAGRVRKQLEALEVGQRLAMELEGLMYRLQAQEHESRQVLLPSPRPSLPSVVVISLSSCSTELDDVFCSRLTP